MEADLHELLAPVIQVQVRGEDEVLMAVVILVTKHSSPKFRWQTEHSFPVKCRQCGKTMKDLPIVRKLQKGKRSPERKFYCVSCAKKLTLI